MTADSKPSAAVVSDSLFCSYLRALEGAAPPAPSAEIASLREQLENEWRSTVFHRRARRLSKAMLPHLTILPEGKELLIWIRAPDVSTNLDALAHWVGEQLRDPDFDLTCGSGSELSELLSRLERHCQWQDAANDNWTE